MISIKLIESKEILSNKKFFEHPYLEERNKRWKNPNLPLWSEVKYAGDKNFPDMSLSTSGTYPTFFISIDENGIFDKITQDNVPGKYYNLYE